MLLTCLPLYLGAMSVTVTFDVFVLLVHSELFICYYLGNNIYILYIYIYIYIHHFLLKFLKSIFCNIIISLPSLLINFVFAE